MLMHERDALVAVESTGVGDELTRRDAHERRLSRAVLTDESEDLAATDLERDVVDGAIGAE
jgi:hypothetical protein